MKKILLIFSAVVLCLLPQTAFGWDDAGHKVVSYIAWENMTPQARQKAIELFLSAPEDSGLAWLLLFDGRLLEIRQREFFQTASTWPDIVRDNKYPIRREKYHRGNWHYINFFWRHESGKAVDIPDMKPEETNAVERLAFLQKALSDSSLPASERGVYLAWILHLVGDIHQPLHTSARVTRSLTRGDQGGNLFYLEPKREPTDTNKEPRLTLHWYWDSILKYAYPRKDECDGNYIPMIATKIMQLHPMSKLQTQVSENKFEAWAQEGLKTAQTELYPFSLRFDQLPSEKYQKNAINISEKAMALAGYRLARMLNEIFK
jgi:hypothetical protein